MTFSTRMYPIPDDKTFFDDSFFRLIPRNTLEYVLSVGSTIQHDFANQNVYLFNNAFEQYMMRDSAFFGAYSIWFSDPVSFYSGDCFFTGTIGYSSFFHEMGHNVTLNSPASFYYGGRIDGCANAIFSETMAQIYQHATGYELVNDYQIYGLDDDLMTDIKQSLISSMIIVRNAYDTYLSSGKIYQSWYDPANPTNDSFLTFMTLAYKFFEWAENSGSGYREPLKRMMQILDYFNPDWQEMYDPLNNSSEGSTFRSTLMVSAISYAFETDLRDEFRDLNFPVDDSLYNTIYTFGTGISQQIKSGEILIYPNPAKDFIYLRDSNPSTKTLKIEFVDETGRFLRKYEVENGSRISLREIPFIRGLLLIKIYTSDQLLIKKVLVD
jgi:hypothetical protein